MESRAEIPWSCVRDLRGVAGGIFMESRAGISWSRERNLCGVADGIFVESRAGNSWSCVLNLCGVAEPGTGVGPDSGSWSRIPVVVLEVPAMTLESRWSCARSHGVDVRDPESGVGI